MKLLFSFDTAATKARAGLLMGALRGRGHEVVCLDKPTDPTPYDAWFFDLQATYEESIRPFSMNTELSAYKGVAICISFDDGPSFHAGRLYDPLRPDAYLSNVLWKDLDKYHGMKAKLGLLYNFIESSTYHQTEKQPRVFFAGQVTGMAPDYLLRVKMIEVMRKSGLSFVGGLTGIDKFHKKRIAELPEDVRFQHVAHEKFVRLMSESLINLCPCGNGPTSYRFFEALASGSLVLASSMDDYQILGMPQKGIHYDAFDIDNLVEKCKTYLDNPEQAQSIAANGQRLWREVYAIDGTWSSLVLSRIEELTGLKL